ncbi:phosphonate utilization associated transcriptional regulator [Undibacterium sp.]|jgi:phosphonate utilization transcriptional regulator|uniref:phosphonate utilization associated transcriptional regulator n=1 Tax=Undibacterium sp. TaxID=1914977 RepID=UPI002B9E1CA6|nr:phosphonate utilization associated transcriptional regulator [Undibacterium sp.]HTD03897.1 phosphonate utilization associated transcriptional regulator [Undibacterium sp.]
MTKQRETNTITLVQQTSLPMLVQRELERLILSGDLASGAKLNEALLAEKLGVSRGPVREAFRSLEESGLVRQEKNCGVFVRQVSIEEADEIYEVRAALDELVGRKLAASITPQQIKEVQALLEKMDKMVEKKNVDAYSALNLEFHDLLVRLTGNQKLLATYRRLVNELNLYRRNALAQQGTLPVSTREHREIFARIASGDADAAGAIMRQHVMESRNRMHRAHAGASVNPP